MVAIEFGFGVLREVLFVALFLRSESVFLRNFTVWHSACRFKNWEEKNTFLASIYFRISIWIGPKLPANELWYDNQRWNVLIYLLGFLIVKLFFFAFNRTFINHHRFASMGKIYLFILFKLFSINLSKIGHIFFIDCFFFLSLSISRICDFFSLLILLDVAHKWIERRRECLLCLFINNRRNQSLRLSNSTKSIITRRSKEIKTANLLSIYN